jgi:LacI family transcriptional regulator
LERRFRKFIRRSPQEEIRNVKINLAKQLLLDTEKPLAEIAEDIGFEHPEYLSVMFKRLTGSSPRDFRQRHRKPA